MMHTHSRNSFLPAPLSGAGGVHSFPSSPPQAKALMLFNLATVFSIKKDYEKARRALQQVSWTS